MRLVFQGFIVLALFLVQVVHFPTAQTGSSGTIEGVVKDPSGAAVVGATVEIKDPVSGYLKTTNTNSEGAFRFSNVPFNPYHMTMETLAGLSTLAESQKNKAKLVFAGDHPSWLEEKISREA
jgi:hypothetical protein